jgi:hypothetical protein
MANPAQGIVAKDDMKEGWEGVGERGFQAFSRRAGHGKIDHPGGSQISYLKRIIKRKNSYRKENFLLRAS